MSKFQQCMVNSQVNRWDDHHNVYQRQLNVTSRALHISSNIWSSVVVTGGGGSGGSGGDDDALRCTSHFGSHS